MVNIYFELLSTFAEEKLTGAMTWGGREGEEHSAAPWLVPLFLSSSSCSLPPPGSAVWWWWRQSLLPGEMLLSSPSGVLSLASSRLTPSSRPTKMRRALWESTREATTSPDATALLQCCVGDRHCSLTIPSTVHTTQTTLCDAILQHSVEVSLSILWV
jgi:hypothetical protein